MLTPTMHGLSFIGSTGFLSALLVIVYWCVDRRLGARGAVLLALSGALNAWLKLVFHDPRPFWTDASVTGREPLSSFGMPSGHAQTAAVFWGFLAARTRLPWAVALLPIVLIGISRIELGVHSLGQVAAGWLIGAAFLAVALWCEPRVVPWWTRRPLVQQLGLSLAVAVAFAAGMWAVARPLDGWSWPVVWAQRIMESGGDPEPISTATGAAAAGGLFGLLAGLSLASSLVRHETGGQVWRRLARIPVGAAGALMIYASGLFAGPEHVSAFFVEALIALWATAGAPEVFIRLNLAERTPRALTQAGEGRPAVLQ